MHIYIQATGKPPWTEEGFTDSIPALIQIATTTVPPKFPSNLSAEGLDFLSKCMVVDYKQRWTAQMLRDHDFLLLEQGKSVEPVTPRTPSFAFEAAAKGRNKQEERDAALVLATRQVIHRGMNLMTGLEVGKQGWAGVFSKDAEMALPSVTLSVGLGLPMMACDKPKKSLVGLVDIIDNFSRLSKEPRKFRVESTKNTSELMDHSSKTAMWKWEIAGVVLENAKRFKATGTASATFEQGFDREKGGAAFARITGLEVVWDANEFVKEVL